MPHPLQTPRLGEALRRLVGDRGHVGLQLIEDVQPGLDLLANVPELRILRQQKSFRIQFTVPAAAGAASKGALYNVGAARLVIIERIFVTPAAGPTSINVYCTTASAAPIGTFVASLPADLRILPVPGGAVPPHAGQCRSENATGVLAISRYDRLNVTGGVSPQYWELRSPIVLPGPDFWGLAPGGAGGAAGVIVENQTLNQLLEVGFEWYEVPATPEEYTYLG